MEEIARVYAVALFEAARDNDKLDSVQGQLGQFTDALQESDELRTFFLGPYFSSTEKKAAVSRAVVSAEPELVNFLEALAERNRMPVIYRVRRIFDEMWAKENRRLAVTLTSAVQLDPKVSDDVRRAVEEQTGQTVDLTSRVDDGIVGGLILQVGNMVLDASIRNRLEKLRKGVAQAT